MVLELAIEVEDVAALDLGMVHAVLLSACTVVAAWGCAFRPADAGHKQRFSARTARHAEIMVRTSIIWPWPSKARVQLPTRGSAANSIFSSARHNYADQCFVAARLVPFRAYQEKRNGG